MINPEDHVSEKANLRMLIRMADGSPKLAPFVEKARLKESLAHATSSFSVYGTLNLP
jgi:hypothetical protein